MLLPSLAVVALVVFVVVSIHRGLWPALTVALLSAMILMPRRLTNNSTVENTGLAGSAPDAYTYSVVIVGAALLILLDKRSPINRIFLPFVILAIFGASFSWQSTSLVHAGLLQLALGILAWGVGAHLSNLYWNDLSFEKFISAFLLCVIILETVICLAQLAGFSINSMDEGTASIMGSRVNGTMNHPNNLGKVMLFLVILLTPLMRSEDPGVRRKSIGGILLAFLPMALSGGRATFIAGLIVVILTGLLSRGVKGRIALPVGVFLLILPFLNSIWQRFEEDPEGGSRGYLLDIAIRQILANPWNGIGPNSYVSLVGMTDALTATGLPVHNTFLLGAAELGIPTAAALFLPLLYVGAVAWKSRSIPGYVGASAVTYLAAAPAWILVAATGWGMMSTSILPLWFLTLGYIAGPFLQRMKPNASTLLTSAPIGHPDSRDAFHDPGLLVTRRKKVIR